MLHLDHAYQKLITFVDNTEDLDFVMAMYNLLEYRNNYSITSGSLWNYYRDGVNDAANENDAANKKINNKTTSNKSFEYKTKLIGSTQNNNSSSTANNSRSTVNDRQ